MSTDRPIYNLRQRNVCPETTDEPSPVKEKKYARTNAQLQREYRSRMKEDSTLYRAFRDCDNLRVQIYRAEKKKAQYREKTRERVRRFRAKKKAEGLSTAPKKQPVTRSTQEKQREKWRTTKATQRSVMTAQGKRRQNESRRQKYAETRQPKSNKSTVDHTASTPAASRLDAMTPIFASKNALKTAVRRAKKQLPTTSEKFAEVITHLVSSASPTSKLNLKARCIISPNSKRHLQFWKDSAASVKRTMQNLSKKRNTADIQKKRTIATALSVKKKYLRKKMQLLGLPYKCIKQAATGSHARKRRKDALETKTVEKVLLKFYNRGDVTRNLPDARSAKKTGSLIIGRKVMECTLKGAYNRFQTENPELHLSFSKFQKLKPINILTRNNTKREACLCEYCLNIDFKLQALTTFTSLHHMSECALKDKYEVSRSTLCDKDGPHYKRSCLDRTCLECGPQLLDVTLQPLLDVHADAPISWFRWQMETINYGENPVKRMCKVRKAGKISDIITELKSESTPFSRHLFNANWQWKMYDEIVSKIPQNLVVFCMDFAENYTCKAQDEAQGAHWSNVQCTIHPIVASYSCPVNDCSSVVTDSMRFISDDIKHCQHAVQHFNSLAIKHLQDQGIPIHKLIHFSDGAASQYKSKVNFVDASFSNSDFGFATEKHYFGSRHGKGPCDREIGVLKKQVGLDINSRRVEVGNARDLFNYGQHNLTRPKLGSAEHVHSKREFYYVGLGDITRDRPGRTAVNPLKKTQQTHMVCGVRPYVVKAKKLSCFCQQCLTDDNSGSCPNLELTEPWVEANLKKKSTCDYQIPQIDAQAPEDTVPTSQALDKPVTEGITTPPADLQEELLTEAQASEASHEGETDLVAVGDFVAVRVEGKGKKKRDEMFVAKVASMDGGYYHLHYMTQHAQLYTWPSGDEHYYLHPAKDIVCKLSSPEPVLNGSRLYSKFNMETAYALFTL